MQVLDEYPTHVDIRKNQESHELKKLSLSLDAFCNIFVLVAVVVSTLYWDIDIDT